METAQRRLDVYFEQTMPLIEHYRGEGNLREIDGRQDIGQVMEAMLQALGIDAAKSSS
jgi:adenylate kinase